MRKVLISVAAAASALAFATPAAAQYFPVPQGYGYGYNNYGHARAFQARIDALQRHITNLDRRRLITNREARSLRDESRAIERRLRETARYGLTPREHRAVEVRIARLEQRIHHEVNDGRRWNRGYGYGYGYDGYGDRDRDGRNDRYEDDRGWDHD